MVRLAFEPHGRYPDTRNLKCQVHLVSGRQRPWIELEATDHPLSVEMRNGITFERLVAIYSRHGHVIGVGSDS